MPDIFSCSYGVSDKIKEYIQPYANTEKVEILDCLKKIGYYNERLYAIPWCLGVYCFISTDTYLTKAGCDIDENLKLSDMALNLGYEIKQKKGTKIISSLTYGASNYLSPKKAFSSYTNKDIVVVSEYALDKSSDSQTQYTSYSKFIAGESVMLLGTQRDIARMENRVKNGKVSKVFYEQINTYTDLIQFSFLAKNDDLLKCEYAEKFANFLIKNKNQKNLSKIGMFPVTGQIDLYEKGIMLNITLNLSAFRELKTIF